ncbi:hypothetical protein BTM25_49700 [Actinomadura rubteroloni]|uniref:V8-like Glu-specific endopeptidase n=1 Tax=Actinomadura rubteroloni TaxID=1926885 RepID=A0A2P4UCK2_9ACTN|nr:hypothetical protein [Actinomadura rubteroloni]POM22766.1 hypothetical protein BTM25_49700 [Actinomadura rubteroloni]
MRSALRLITTTATAGVLAAAMASAANAAPANPGGTSASTARLTGGGAVTSAAAVEQVSKYWTAARMKAARPVPEPKAPAGVPAVAATATGNPGSSPSAAAIASAANKLAGGDAKLAASITESKVVGKVFFHKPSGGDWVCSASALNSPSKQLVITAGHCVHEGKGGKWMTNWTFVPRYRNGSRPFGTFAAKQFRTFNTWISSSAYNRDVGMVTTWPLNGRKLVNVVGGNGLSWNYPKNVAVTVLGYPKNFSSGQIQAWCKGTTRDAGGGRIALNCNFQPGSSGGPWIRNFDNTTGRGQTNGVTSTISTTGGVNKSPYFDTAVKNMFDAQGSVT